MGRYDAAQATRRVEDRRFLTGRGCYTDDLKLPDSAGTMLHAVFVRSPYAHAEIRGIDISMAMDAPGVLLVLTGDDLDQDGLKPLPVLARPKGMRAPPRRALPKDKARFVGEAVAMVVAETATQARDAAERVMVDFEPLEAVTDPLAAVSEGAPQLWEEVPDNLYVDWELGDKAATEAAFAKAARVVALDLINNRVSATSMEPRGAVGLVEPDSGRLCLHVGNQDAHAIRTWLAQSFDCAPEDVRVVSPDVGGGFGMKIYLYPEYVLVLYAARRLGRPVKWIAERSEGFLSDTHGRGIRSHAELALDAQGRFLGLRVGSLATIGAAPLQGGAHAATVGGNGMLTGTYVIPSLHVRVRVTATNTGTVGAYRGAGRPEAAYVIERLVDKAAREIGMTPEALRRLNFIPPEAMPYETPGGKRYDTGRFAETMDKALALADAATFPERREAARARGRLAGLGIGYYIESSAGGAGENTCLSVDSRGCVTLTIGTLSNGQGHETAYAQMIAESLGVPMEAVTVIQGDTDRVPVGFGTRGSRSLPSGGAALARGLEDLIEKGRERAARRLEAAAADIEFSQGRYRVAGTDLGVSLAEVAAGLEGVGTYKPPQPNFPNGCHVCELEVDPETGQVFLLRHTVVDDVGTVVNPTLLNGQIVGGTAQGIGQALMEHALYDESGQMLTGSLMDYALPRADDIPPVVHDVNPVFCKTNPLGIKGAGEAGATGAPPAVMNALMDALAPLGVTHIDMPATPLAVWQAIEAARKGG